MRFFRNTPRLKEYLHNSIKKTKKDSYNEDIFFEDFIRSQDELSIKGVPIAEVLGKSPHITTREALQQTVDSLLEPIFKNYPRLNEKDKTNFNQFLRLFLHQNSLLHDSILFVTEEMSKKGITPLATSTKPDASEISIRNVNLSFADNALYIQQAFTLIEYYNEKKQEKITAKKNSFFVQGKTLYKINIAPQEKGWHAQCTIVDASFKCNGPFKLLDTRNIYERLIAYLKEFIQFFNRSNKDNQVDINAETFSGIASKVDDSLCSFVSNNGSSIDDILLSSYIKLNNR